MIKKIKKEKDVSVAKTTTNKSVQIPLAGVIVFSVLLAASSFFAGAAWLKMGGNSDTNTISTTATTTFEPSKSDKPEFQFYVMSFCPFGNQMEDLIKPVAELLGNKADIRPQYIFDKVSDLKTFCQQSGGDASKCADYIKAGYFQTEAECKTTINEYITDCQNEKNYLKIGDSYYSSLHGRVEANQNVREICAFNIDEDKTNWWKFIDNTNKNCDKNNADTCWEDQAKKAGFDTNKITECFNTQAAELIDKEIELTTKNKVQGSPTLKINGVDFPPETAYAADNKGSLKIGKKIFTQDKYRTSEAIKEAICASFNKAPKECKTVIKDVAADASANNGNAVANDANCN